jgi:hypothetical protein
MVDRGAEVLCDTSHVVAGARQHLTHPAIILNPAWYARVWRAGDELGTLYQEIGAVHFSGGEVPKRS